MIDAILLMVTLLGAAVLAYWIGKDVGKHVRTRLEADLVTERAVRHNLNCLVGDLKHELKGKTHAIDALTGLWATDQPDLIKHHAKKERFFRIGYPEHHL